MKTQLPLLCNLNDNVFPFSFPRSLCEGFPNVWRSQTEEEEDINKEEYSESNL